MASLKSDQKVISEALHKAQALRDILEQEFTFLKNNELDAFEKIQVKKSDTLNYLTENSPAIYEKFEQRLDDSSLIEAFKVQMNECKSLHLRNALLVDRKLASTRSALELFKTPHNHSFGETYDKLGKLSKSSKVK